jgi:transposase
MKDEIQRMVICHVLPLNHFFMSNSIAVELMLRVSLGIDVSKAKLNFTLSGQTKESKHFFGSGEYPNTPNGFQKIIEFCKKHLKTDDLSFVFVILEATGVYHQCARQFLYDSGLKVIEVLPNKSKAFTKVVNVKTKNDIVDAKVLSIYGLTMTEERLWKPFSTCYDALKALTRHRESLTIACTRLKNKHHATMSAYKPNEFVLDSEKSEIAHFTKSIKTTDTELTRIVKENLDVKVLFDRLQTIPGIGPTTALVLLAETNGFKDFTSRRQLVSYAGLDVVERSSGKSVKSEHHISKRGNAHIRRILYNGAAHFAQKDEAAEKLKTRLGVDGDAKGRVPVMRKMLTIALALVKTEKDFDPALRPYGSKLINLQTGEVIQPRSQNAELVPNQKDISTQIATAQETTNTKEENTVSGLKGEDTEGSTCQIPKKLLTTKVTDLSINGPLSENTKSVTLPKESCECSSIKEDG